MSDTFITHMTVTVDQALIAEKEAWYEQEEENGKNREFPQLSFNNMLYRVSDALGLEKAGFIGEMGLITELARLTNSTPGFVIFMLNAWAIGTDPLNLLKYPEAVFPENTNEILGAMLLKRSSVLERNYSIGIVEDGPMKDHKYFKMIVPYFFQEARYFISGLLSEPVDFGEPMLKAVFGITLEELATLGDSIRIKDEPAKEDGEDE
jgi:hypothetical protein